MGLRDEPHIAARKRHIEICDGNLCAAILIQEFIYDFRVEDTPDPYDLEEYEEEASSVATRIIYTHQLLQENILLVFSLEEVHQALLLLMSKGFINATWTNSRIDGQESTPFELRNIAITVDWDKIEQACEPYYAKIKAKHDQEQAERQAKLEEEQAKLPPPPPPPSPEEVERKKREAIFNRELSRVEQHIRRALSANLPGTLTIAEWLETLNHFNWKCAYCSGSYDLLEHFIPIVHYGGTTIDNCVPACHGCNSVKKSWHPSKIPTNATKQNKIVRQNIAKVQQFLESRRKAEETNAD